MNSWLTPIIEAYKTYFPVPERVLVWEVGSRDGDDGVELAERLGGGAEDCVLVEANPEQAALISQYHPNATVHCFAAYNETGESEFVVYHGNAGDVGSSSLNLGWKEGDGLDEHVITVPTVRLDSVIGDEQIDVMKIDVEGKSVEVLEGLGDKVRQVRVLHVETERWTGSDKAVISYLVDKGFMLVHEDEQYGDMPDQVWVRLP